MSGLAGTSPCLPVVALLVSGIGYRPSLQTQHLGLFGSMTVLSVLLGYWVYRTRRTRGGRLFAVTLFSLALRLGSDVVHGLVGELWTFQSVLVGLNPLLELCTLAVFLRFAGRYAGFESLGDERSGWLLAGVVAAAATLVATNPAHGLVFTGFERNVAPFTHVTGHLGIAGFALQGVNGALLLACAGLLAHAFTRGERPAWWSAGVLAIGITQAALVGWVNLTIGGVVPGYDYTAIGLGGFVLVTAAGLLAHGLRRIEVVARRRVLDDVDDAVVLLDRTGSVVEYNAAASKLFPGIEEGEAFTDRFDDPATVPLEPGSARTDLTLSAADAPSTEIASQSDGSENPEGAPAAASDGDGDRFYDVHTTSVTAATGEPLGYTARFADVTDLRRRSRELRRTNERLDQFAATVSHDLRNPLNVASGHLEMVAASNDPDDPMPLDVDDALASLEKIDGSLDRMNAIIDDILALVRHADPVTETAPVEFADVAAAAWESVDTGAATHRVTGGAPLEADRDRLQRLLENLYRNAIDHVGEGVTVETGRTGDGFYVADDGPGIPESDRERIFEHGFTTGADGTGLGLSIVAQLAEAHGWEIALDPDHDGTRFVVSGCETPADSASPDLQD